MPSKGRSTLGIEWEFLLVDPETRELASAAPAILTDICPPGQESHPRAKFEFMENTVEAITGVCTTVAQATADLSATVDEVRAAANKRGIELFGSGAHPFSRWRDQKITDGGFRYEQMIERQRNQARRLMINGAHFHVGVVNQDHVIPIVNAVTNYLPHLLAISASSPYWQGEDTGFASIRSLVFAAMSTGGLPPIFENWADYENMVGAFIKANAIVDMRQLWWDIRPHPDFGTIEIRVADCPSTFSEIGAIAAIAQCLIERFAQQLESGYTLPVPKGWIVHENKWRAARYGLDAHFLVNDSGLTVPARDAIVELVHDLTPTANRMDCAAELATVTRILTDGASYERQRAIAVGSGGDLTKVVDHLIAEMRDGLSSEQRSSDNLTLNGSRR